MKRKQIFSIFEIKYCETQFLINKWNISNRSSTNNFKYVLKKKECGDICFDMLYFINKLYTGCK